MYIVQFLCNIAFKKATDFRLKFFLICHFVKSNCVYEKLKQLKNLLSSIVVLYRDI